jgi:hypothetical protein
MIALGERDRPAVGETSRGATVFRAGCHVSTGWNSVRPDVAAEGYEWDRTLVEAARQEVPRDWQSSGRQRQGQR